MRGSSREGREKRGQERRDGRRGRVVTVMKWETLGTFTGRVCSAVTQALTPPTHCSD